MQCLSGFELHSRWVPLMITSVPFAFQVRSLQGLIKLETELARRTARRAQVKQLKSEKLSPCSRGNLEDSNACPSTTLSWLLSTSKVLFLETPKTGTVLILLLEINDFLQNRQLRPVYTTEKIGTARIKRRTAPTQFDV